MPRAREDHAIYELVNNPKRKCGKGIRVTTPSNVVDIQDADELKHQLEHYSHPFLKHLVPKTTFARRFHVERVRPALRYYCNKFQVKVPPWLASDAYYLELPDDEKLDMFGTTELHVREFTKTGFVPGGEVHAATE